MTDGKCHRWQVQKENRRCEALYLSATTSSWKILTLHIQNEGKSKGSIQTWSTLVLAGDAPCAVGLSHHSHPGLILARRTPCAVALLGQTCHAHESFSGCNAYINKYAHSRQDTKQREIGFAGISCLNRKRATRSSVPKSRSASMGWVNREDCPVAKIICLFHI